MLPSIFGENLFDNFMDFDHDFFGRPFKHDASVMKTDVKETDNDYELTVDLPGFDKDDVSVKLENGNLIIAATQKANNDQKDDKGNYVRRERYYGSCNRQFYVGDAVKEDDIHAKMDNGVLTVDIPKKDQKEVEQSHMIQIEG